MDIILFSNYNFNVIHDKDDTERSIGYSELNDVQVIGRNHFYPNCLFYLKNDNKIISPYDEKIMSLYKDSFYDKNKEININEYKQQIEIYNPVFFFIYNFDNYYHFLYDTLPYLYTYLELKKKIKNLKLLINKLKYRFNEDLLFKIVSVDDIIYHEESNYYKKVYISSSLTHGGFSNNPPRKEINKIYDILKNNIEMNNVNKNLINKKRLYISRRTWINNDTSNIGTNYTTRRKMINEDEFVNNLKKYDIDEIFTENINIDEKIYIFTNAELIIGSIGGGMANLIFSNYNVKSIIIVTPYFLDINYRFKYSLEKSNYIYFYDTSTYKEYEKQKYSLYCRVEILKTKRIGEIDSYNFLNGLYLIKLSNNDVAGFSLDKNFEKAYYREEEFRPLDFGLNSPYIVDIYKFNLNLM